MEEIKAIKESLNEVIKTVEKIAERVEKLEKQVKQNNSSNNGYMLEFRGNVIKFKDSGYNNDSAMLVTEKPKKKQSMTIAITKEEWEAFKKLGDCYFYGNYRNNDYTLIFRGNVIKFKDSGYNNGSAMFIIEKPKKKQSITVAITAEEWEELKKLGDSYFYGNNGKSYRKKSNNRSYSKKTYSKKSYGKKNSYRKSKEELEVEEASYDDALE